MGQFHKDKVQTVRTGNGVWSRSLLLSSAPLHSQIWSLRKSATFYSLQWNENKLHQCLIVYNNSTFPEWVSKWMLFICFLSLVPLFLLHHPSVHSEQVANGSALVTEWFLIWPGSLTYIANCLSFKGLGWSSDTVP